MSFAQQTHSQADPVYPSSAELDSIEDQRAADLRDYQMWTRAWRGTMRFYMIAGLAAPKNVWDQLIVSIKGWGCEAIGKHQGDKFDDATADDILVGHSIGAHDALHLYNHAVGSACLCLDYVSQDFWPRLFLIRPTAERMGVKSLQRIIPSWASTHYPRSTAIVNASCETLDIEHDQFIQHPRTAELIYHFIKYQSWE